MCYISLSDHTTTLSRENYGPPHAPGTKTGASAASAPNFAGAEALPTTSASTASAAAVADFRAGACFFFSLTGSPGGTAFEGSRSIPSSRFLVRT